MLKSSRNTVVKVPLLKITLAADASGEERNVPLQDTGVQVILDVAKAAQNQTAYDGSGTDITEKAVNALSKLLGNYNFPQASSERITKLVAWFFFRAFLTEKTRVMSAQAGQPFQGLETLAEIYVDASEKTIELKFETEIDGAASATLTAGTLTGALPIAGTLPVAGALPTGALPAAVGTVTGKSRRRRGGGTIIDIKADEKHLTQENYQLNDGYLTNWKMTIVPTDQKKLLDDDIIKIFDKRDGKLVEEYVNSALMSLSLKTVKYEGPFKAFVINITKVMTDTNVDLNNCYETNWFRNITPQPDKTECIQTLSQLIPKNPSICASNTHVYGTFIKDWMILQYKDSNTVNFLKQAEVQTLINFWHSISSITYFSCFPNFMYKAGTWWEKTRTFSSMPNGNEQQFHYMLRIIYAYFESKDFEMELEDISNKATTNVEINIWKEMLEDFLADLKNLKILSSRLHNEERDEILKDYVKKSFKTKFFDRRTSSSRSISVPYFNIRLAPGYVDLWTTLLEKMLSATAIDPLQIPEKTVIKVFITFKNMKPENLGNRWELTNATDINQEEF